MSKGNKSRSIPLEEHHSFTSWRHDPQEKANHNLLPQNQILHPLLLHTFHDIQA